MQLPVPRTPSTYHNKLNIFTSFFPPPVMIPATWTFSHQDPFQELSFTQLSIISLPNAIYYSAINHQFVRSYLLLSYQSSVCQNLSITQLSIISLPGAIYYSAINHQFVPSIRVRSYLLLSYQLSVCQVLSITQLSIISLPGAIYLSAINHQFARCYILLSYQSSV